MRRGALRAALLALYAGLASARPDARASAEIEGLLQGLADSGCEFQRNGRWYPAAEAQAHLRRKYDYLLGKDLVDSAEQFIDRAGSRSSLSGRDYQVRCHGAVQASERWLGEALRQLRARAGGGEAAPTRSDAAS